MRGLSDAAFHSEKTSLLIALAQVINLDIFSKR